ncbi:MAG: nucleotide sugar dehydrogenase, partial [Candidatus Omnitrophica bacterium]|nr:nucleotide sugar dehydrogenase [Candidatus Omnitrophota bacterium]
DPTGKELTLSNVIASLKHKELHYLLYLHNLREINDENQNQFLERRLAREFTGDLSGKSVAILGVGYRQGDKEITKSPALKTIRALVSQGVKTFYIAEPYAQEALSRWVEEIRSHQADGIAVSLQTVTFVMKDRKGQPLSIYEAMKLADLAVIPTLSHPDLRNLDLDKMSESLGRKLLVDGVNLFGLRADGTLFAGYTIQDLRRRGIRYVSVGRVAVDDETSRQGYQDGHYELYDSRIIGPAMSGGSKEAAVGSYEDSMIQLQDDPERASRLQRAREITDQAQKESAMLEEIRKKVVVIGGGYVGLTTGTELADLGHDVTVIDIPSKRQEIEALNSDKTKVPIHEPGLRDWIVKNKKAGRLRFAVWEVNPVTNEWTSPALEDASVVYLAVGTPQRDDGSQDPRFVTEAAEQIASIIRSQRDRDRGKDSFKTIVIKSTVTPDVYEIVGRRIYEKFNLQVGRDYGLVSNPEFLREGQAIQDITGELDRNVLGFFAGMTPDQRRRVEREMLELWYPLMLRYPHHVLLTDTATSAIVKYAANAFLAISISLINMLAENSALVDADIEQITPLLKRDPRIGANAFVYPGPGYGGSCFPKDVRALNSLSEVEHGPVLMIVLTDALNEYYKTANVAQLVRAIKIYTAKKWPAKKWPLINNKVAMLGLSFKPKTDDMREAPSAHILYELLNKGVYQVRVDDPIFRTPDAPSRETTIRRFLGELYKHFKKDVDFNRAFQEFLTEDDHTDEFLSALFTVLRHSDAFRKRFQKYVQGDRQDDRKFQKEYGSYFHPKLLVNPFDRMNFSSARKLQEFLKGVVDRGINGEILPVVKEVYFHQCYFQKQILDRGRVVFAESAEHALEGADAVVIVTDWPEYRNLDLSLFEGKPVIDTRNIYYGELSRFRERGILVVGPGRAASYRAEVRNVNPTRQFTEQLMNRRLPSFPGAESLKNLIRVYPRLGTERVMMQAVTANFY